MKLLNLMYFNIYYSKYKEMEKKIEIFGVSSFNDNLDLRIDKQNIKINSGDIGLLEENFLLI